MRRYLIVSFLLLGLLTGYAQAKDGHRHDLQCSYSSDYDVRVKPEGIAFTRSSGYPRDVFMHDGQLQIDEHAVAVSRADADRLRQFEQEVRDLVPAVAAIARDGVDIGYSALTTVVATLADNGDERTQLLQKLRDQRGEAMQHIDVTLGRGDWNVGEDDTLFSDHLQKTVEDIVGNVTGDAVKDALSGDSTKLAALQERTAALDATLDKAVNAPADKLEKRAKALCPQLSQLEQLQQQFQFRLAHGARLQLITPDMDRSYKASQYAQR